MKNIFLLMLICLVASCATPNPYAQWYTQYNDDLLLPTEETELIEVSPQSFLNTRDELFTQGYQLIGESNFNWDLKNRELAVEHGRNISADKVVVTSDFTDSNTFTSGIVSYGLGAAPITSTQRRFDQNALYFSKSIKKLKYGVYYDQLTGEEKQKYEINNGLKIRVVVNNLPMFKAGLIPGDIILEIDGRKVLTQDDFYDDDNVSNLKIMRNGRVIELTVNT